jgi:hypothetical protein
MVVQWTKNWRKVAPEGTRGDDRHKWESLNGEALSPVLGVWGRLDFSSAS